MLHDTKSHRGPSESLLVWIVLVGLLILAGLLPFWRLGDRDLWSSHEARAASNARSLLEPGNNGLPRGETGAFELQKPPLFYWLVAGIAFWRGGVDELAVRLPSALAAVVTLLALVLGIGLGLGRPLAAVLAGLILATGIHFPWLARIGRIDMPLTAAVSLSALSFLVLLNRRLSPLARWGLVLLGWSACTVGVLLKGPIGLLLPGAIVVAHLLLEGRWPAFWEYRAWADLLARLKLGSGIAILLTVVVPIFLWLDHVSEGQFAREFLWLHNVQRGLGGSRLRSHPWWLYFPFLGLYLLPATPFLLLGLFRWRDWWADGTARLGLAWLVGVFLLLSAAHFKRADYLLPAYPGAALLLGCIVERWLARPWGERVLAGVVLVVLLSLTGWVYRVGWSLPAEEPYRDYRVFARHINAQANSTERVIFFRTEAHALAFRLGRPIVRLVEWHELQSQLRQPGTHLLVLPVALADEVRHRLADCSFELLCQNTSPTRNHERPMLCWRAGRARATAAVSFAASKPCQNCQPCPPSPTNR